MVGLFNQVRGTSLNNWVSDQASQIAFGRGWIYSYSRMHSWLTAVWNRIIWLRRDQLLGLSLDQDIYNFLAGWVVL